MEYVIISGLGIVVGLLTLALALQTWRKRVWKRRAIADSPGPWHVIRAAFVEELDLKPTPKKHLGWPDIIDKNDK